MEKDERMKENVSNTNKLLKKRRVTRYFIDAAREIAKEDGISAVTIRAVAKRAGYNSATLYNYFENLDQLLAFVCLDILTDLIRKCSEIQKGEGDALDKYISSWREHCKFSFQDPAIYAYMYISEKTEMIKKSFTSYYTLFLEDEEQLAEETIHAFLSDTLYEQEKYSIELSVAAGFFREEDGDGILTLGLLLYRGLLLDFTLPNNRMTEAEAVRTFMYYFVFYLQSKVQKDKDLSQYISL